MTWEAKAKILVSKHQSRSRVQQAPAHLGSAACFLTRFHNPTFAFPWYVPTMQSKINVLINFVSHMQFWFACPNCFLSQQTTQNLQIDFCPRHSQSSWGRQMQYEHDNAISATQYQHTASLTFCRARKWFNSLANSNVTCTKTLSVSAISLNSKKCTYAHRIQPRSWHSD